MSRELRRVPKDWEHPADKNGAYRALHGRDLLAYYEPGETWDEADFMPAWNDEEATHFQMYETTSEGTPISPVMATIEELARWLADNRASAFGRETVSYEQWLAMCQAGWAPTGVMTPDGIKSGVADSTRPKVSHFSDDADGTTA